MYDNAIPIKSIVISKAKLYVCDKVKSVITVVSPCHSYSQNGLDSTFSCFKKEDGKLITIRTDHILKIEEI